MLAIDDQTAGPNGPTYFEGTYEYPGSNKGNNSISNFFLSNFFSFQKSTLVKNIKFKNRFLLPKMVSKRNQNNITTLGTSASNL